jgi:hypothetical protein
MGTGIYFLERQGELQATEQQTDTSGRFQGLDFGGDYDRLQDNEPREFGEPLGNEHDELEDGDMVGFGEDVFGEEYHGEKYLPPIA